MYLSLYYDGGFRGNCLNKIKEYISSYLDQESAINSLSLEIEMDNKIKLLKKELNRIQSSISEQEKKLWNLYM